MPLLGPVAFAISFDIESAAIADHDDWHSREHMPDRLSIPGFRRGSRWRRGSGTPGYLALYEVDAIEVMKSQAYLQVVNNPSPWTTRMMTHYSNITRSYCRVVTSIGQGLGGCMLLMRFDAADGRDDDLRQGLAGDVLPRLLEQPGLLAAHLLESAMPTQSTTRGKDAEARFVLLITGYDSEVVEGLLSTGPLPERLRALGASDGTPADGVYRLQAALAAGEVLSSA